MSPEQPYAPTESTRDALAVRLWGVLGDGIENIATSAQIARWLDINQKGVGFLVAHAREMGYPIGSLHTKGYFRIMSKDELDQTIAHVLARISALQHTANVLSLAWERHPNSAVNRY